MPAGALQVRPLAGLPEIREGDELGRLISEAGQPADGEIVVLSQKVVSKAEGRLRRLDEVRPGPRARRLAATVDKDPRLVELILSESRAVVRASEGVLIVETAQGLVCANAGIDASNVAGDGRVALLPSDPDGSARRIRAAIEEHRGSRPAVLIADSFGRAWRLGQADVAIGCAGLMPIDDWRGRLDGEGGELSATAIAVADEVAATADLVREKDSRVPGAIVSGLERLVTADDGPGATALRRPSERDLFR
jgi:coenzyme F420-0:L-glutamate ligase/coenzyme F420-1:gamma-L-glutamate ligase